MNSRSDGPWIFFGLGGVFGLLAGAMTFAMLAADDRPSWVEWAQAVGGILAGLIGAGVALVIVGKSVAPAWRQIDLQALNMLQRAADEITEELNILNAAESRIEDATDMLLFHMDGFEKRRDSYMQVDWNSLPEDEQGNRKKLASAMMKLIGACDEIQNELLDVTATTSRVEATTAARSNYRHSIQSVRPTPPIMGPIEPQWLSSAAAKDTLQRSGNVIRRWGEHHESRHREYSVALSEERRQLRENINRIYRHALIDA